jgi:hypothetical protein
MLSHGRGPRAFDIAERLGDDELALRRRRLAGDGDRYREYQKAADGRSFGSPSLEGSPIPIIGQAIVPSATCRRPNSRGEAVARRLMAER